MILYLALGCLLLGVLLGVGGRKKTQRVGGAWRPGAGVLAIAAFVAAAVLAVKEAWAAALVLAGIGAWLATSARARPMKAAPVSPGYDGMSVEEAAAILGVAPDAGDAAVTEAYRRLMQRVHPDRGGASGLAVQLNKARDVMNRRSPPLGS